MFTLILRSFCVGIAAIFAAAVAGAFIGMVIMMSIALRNPSPPGEPEVGWDLVTMFHPFDTRLLCATIFVFVIGFAIGYRFFSRQARST